MIVFDIETHEWDKIYAIGYTADGINANFIAQDNKSNSYFIKWLLDNVGEDVIYSHNGGKFDMLFVFDYCIAHNIEILNIKVIHSSLAMLKIKYKNKTLEFRDSYLILPSSLKKLTNSFNVAHKKLEMDYNIGIKDMRFNDYFTNDILGLYEVLIDADKMGLTDKLTIASASMNEFLSKYTGIKPTPLTNNIRTKLTDFYYGGRTEVFKRYGEDLFYYDINSLYPYVMANYKYPQINSDYELTTNANDIADCDFIYCDVKAPDINIPLIPTKINNKLIFPLGSFTSFITNNEYKFALTLGYEFRFIYGLKASATDYIFKEFVKTNYEIKKHSSGAKREIAKLFLNSLYGKFGQKHIQTKYVIKSLNKIKNKATITDDDLVFIIGDKYIKPIKAITHSDYERLDIAMQITANARLELYKLMQRANMDVYYCDTDSIFTSKELKVSDMLGDIKLESEVKEFVALAPKFYGYKTYDDKTIIHAKGFKSTDISYSQLKAMLNSSVAIKSNYSHLNYFKDYIRNSKLYNYQITKHVKAQYDKRILLTDGINTIPLVIPQSL